MLTVLLIFSDSIMTFQNFLIVAWCRSGTYNYGFLANCTIFLREIMYIKVAPAVTS